MKFLKTISKSINKKTLCIIKLDGIGDYILFRNYLQHLNISGYLIYLIGNANWRELNNFFDNENVKKCIWIDKEKFSKSRIYRLRKSVYIHLFCRAFNLCNLTSSRSFYFDDYISDISRATFKTAFEVDYCNQNRQEKNISDTYYNRIITSKPTFEFFKYKLFFETFIAKKLQVELSLNHYQENGEDSSILFFIGGSELHKKWSIDNFAALGKNLHKKYEKEIIICGVEEDMQNSLYLQNSLVNEKIPVINLCGKTKLNDMMRLIKNSSFVVSNDTSAVHLSAALNTLVFCIYKGDHYGRYLPYPQSLNKKVVTIMPEAELKNDNKISEKPINEITPSRVFDVIHTYLNG